MGRFLFVVPPLVGHVNPAVGTAAALAARGHDIAWAGHPELVRGLAGADAVVFPCALPEDGLSRPAGLKGPAAFQFLWESFLVPLADAMAPGVRAAIEAYDPDVVVCDQQAVAGALVAESLGRPWVTSATTSAELVDPLAGMPKVAAWLDGLLGELRRRITGGAGAADPRFSPHGVLAYTTRALLGPVELPDRVWLVGPSVAARPAGPDDFPWEWLEASALPTVLVSLGTANNDAGARFLNAAAEALGGIADRVRAVLVDPGGVVEHPVPDTVLVRRYVPQLALLERLDAVVCHAGHNTVCEALWHGVPLVVAPIRDDQPIVAAQVVDAGAGVRLRFGRADAARIGAAVEAVLDPAQGHRKAAEAVGESFRAAGGSESAADRLETLTAESAVPGVRGS
ncbi:glycosyl transferase [Streptomyces avermitilis]|uniref:Glycosyltransferase, secreted n=3 Tax=Streptomyces TaxID=1883 RepID=Q825U1_STRAW|nr:MULTISPECIES: glycosyltransferase [Streptomyces]KUN53319.1 glycosyl transferase [Streptomyces avermitilis]MYT02897.1 glycosyltransferase [Streptomyces sp. SID5469]OOV26055.1 glycosyl transferase [Streptomyces avermitilis]BAC75069.1 putative glycosyltransferase, secreted [Streptomyces avermitilis MA-4680 = NBRC 14893]GDY67668.1 glycosyl transferase [Streptomyces avermitilis]